MITYPLLLVFIPIVTAIVVYILEKRWATRLVFVSQAILTGLFLRILSLYSSIEDTRYILGEWSITSGIALKIDDLSLAFIGLAIFIWWIILLYSWEFHADDSKYHFFLLFLEGTFLGLLQVNDLFSFFVFIDIITIISTILVVHKKDGWSLRSGLYYLLINSMGMLTYLLGFIIVYMLTGTLNWDLATSRLSILGPTPPVLAAYILMSASVTVKAAIFPTFNWLSRAHGAAPASVSALLSGLLVKTGIYGFIRIQELFGHPLYLGDFFFYLGFVTALTGIVFAISQKDIKQILAFHTISQVGIILIGVASQKTGLYQGGLIHLFNHALFKSLLFMGAGVLINHYKTRRLTEIRGVFARFPALSITMFVGILSITGAPLFSGYLGKYIIASQLSDQPFFYALFWLINLGTLISFTKFSQIFLPQPTGPGLDAFKLRGQANAPTKAKWFRGFNFPMLVLSLSCIAITLSYNALNLGLGLNLPPVTILSLSKVFSWLLALALALSFSIFFIFSDRLTPLLHRIREFRIPYNVTVYMYILLLATMFSLS